MELKDKLDDATEIYKNECDKKVKQCCILGDVKFHAIDETYMGIVLTPYCDIYQENADYLSIIPMFPLKDFFDDFLIEKKLTTEQIIGNEAISKNKFGNTYFEFVKKYLKNNNNRMYFLPENPDKFEDSIIDLSLIETIPIENFNGDTKICEINSPWREDIVTSYASFCVRVDTADYSEEFLTKIMDKISNLKIENKS